MTDFWPVGSVVVLRGNEKPLMIIGRLQENDGRVWDYSAVYFPEGYLDSQQIFVFQEEDIERVYHVGMLNDDEYALRNYLSIQLAKEGEKEEE
ncbi:MAG: DUF4176 domain-containing protein [Lachnospiraceae bacterium]|nr:DUF4176 domain-containing protein [Lachnospiraceae bacterium]